MLNVKAIKKQSVIMFYISVKPIRSDHTSSIQENSKAKLIFVRVKKPNLFSCGLHCCYGKCSEGYLISNQME